MIYSSLFPISIHDEAASAPQFEAANQNEIFQIDKDFYELTEESSSL
jgi:hypothetical protein